MTGNKHNDWGKKTISSFGTENHKLEKDKFIYSDRFEGLADLKKKTSMVI